MNNNFLKYKRELLGKTQREVADYLGITPQSYFKIENGINNLHPKHWQKIMSYLGLSEKELMSFVGRRSLQRKQHFDAGKIKLNNVDQVLLADTLAQDNRERIDWIISLSTQEYHELVNAYESGRLDVFQIAKIEDIEHFKDRAITGIAKMNIPADIKGKIVDFLGRLDLIDNPKKEKDR